jgi:hypothetical protein
MRASAKQVPDLSPNALLGRLLAHFHFRFGQLLRGPLIQLESALLGRLLKRFSSATSFCAAGSTGEIRPSLAISSSRRAPRPFP